MAKVKEANFGELINWLNITGWDKGLKILEDHLLRTEWLQAHLYGEGDAKNIKAANKLSHTIIKQQMALMQLKNMRPKFEQIQNQTV